MKPMNRLLFPAIAGALAVLGGCLFDAKEARGGSVVENEVLAGTLYNQDGSPAQGALVKVFAVNHAPNDGLLKRSADTGTVFTARTDSLGRFNLDSLSPGEYNFLGEMDGKVSYLDSVAISAKTRSIPPDTLDAPGSITAILALEPNHDPRGAYVQVLGTNRFSAADSTGRFTFSDMADGRYAIRILTIFDGYTPYFGGFTVRSGRVDSLKDTLRPDYTNIPVIRGLKAEYDTLSERALVSWKPARYPFLKEYLVFRDETSSFFPSTSPIAIVKDTFFVDSAVSASGFGFPSGTAETIRKYEYRVLIRNQSGDLGPAFGAAEISAVPRTLIETRITLAVAGRTDGSASINDTVLLEARWENQLLNVDSLIWYQVDGGRQLRRIEALQRSGVDTLAQAVPSMLGDIAYYVRAVDERGVSATSPIFRLDVIADAPVANAGADTAVTIRDTLRLTGRAVQRFGSIVKWEWDIGNKGVFAASEGGIATAVSRSTVGPDLHVLRVTDDDGNVSLDTLKVSVLNDIPNAQLTYAPRLRSQGGGYSFASAISDRGRIVKWEWDIGNSGTWIQGSRGDTAFTPSLAGGLELVVKVRATDEDGNAGTAATSLIVSKWAWEANTPFRLFNQSDYSLAELNGRIHFLGFNPSTRLPEHYAYDPGTGEWELLKHYGITLSQSPLDENRAIGNRIATVDGRLYSVGGEGSTNASRYHIQIYEPSLNEWVRGRDLDRQTINAGVAAIDGKIYVAGGVPNRGLILDVYDTESDTWVRKADLNRMNNFWPHPSSVSWNGKLYVVRAGAVDESNFSRYDPDLDVWTEQAEYPGANGEPSVVVLNGMIYAIGGNGNTQRKVYAYDVAMNLWSERSPSLFNTYGQTAVVVNGKIYSFSDLSKIQVYDPALDQ